MLILETSCAEEIIRIRGDGIDDDERVDGLGLYEAGVTIRTRSLGRRIRDISILK